MSEVKLCKDCKHARDRYDHFEAEWYKDCHLRPHTDIVTGEVTHQECHEARAHFSPCGPEGKLFEAKA